MNITSGWDGGNEDKCCRAGISTCRWFGSLSACQAALPGATAALCDSCRADPSPLGCPTWGAPNATVSALQVMNRTTATVLVALTPSSLPATTAVLINRAGGGAVVTLLLTEATAAEVWLGLLSHLLSRLSDDTSPFAVVDAISGLDARPKVMVQVSRGPSGWNVTLTNNMGVTKEPSTTATIDPTALMTVTVALRPGYGTRITRATATRTGGRALPLSASGNVTLVIPAGDLIVLGLETV